MENPTRKKRKSRSGAKSRFEVRLLIIASPEIAGLRTRTRHRIVAWIARNARRSIRRARCPVRLEA